ncbi:protealysin inhibitor emfourin [Microbacterium fluvii]|uniref:Protealysin inhibitor emfourin n=1 Tax=Microbacterium fluvii TaxID=415215 RepID=A0ABW2H947_9MICO|nr:protealysin inhibitor emfourin [Microbacterium fluvii]MCU4671502.1 hypothetical protein [Microbacterium fluvii]
MDPDPRTDRQLTVTVVRSGGFAGLSREWTASPPEAEAPHWIAMITLCPWDETPAVAPPTDADRFQWRIEAAEPQGVRTALLGDAELTGPWRDLVDAVRAAASA